MSLVPVIIPTNSSKSKPCGKGSHLRGRAAAMSYRFRAPLKKSLTLEAAERQSERAKEQPQVAPIISPMPKRTRGRERPGREGSRRMSRSRGRTEGSQPAAGHSTIKRMLGSDRKTQSECENMHVRRTFARRSLVCTSGPGTMSHASARVCFGSRYSIAR